MEGEELEQAKAKAGELKTQLDDLDEQIKAKQAEIDALPNTKANKGKRNALYKEKQQLQELQKATKKQLRIADNQANGKAVAVKDLLEDEDYRAIFDKKTGIDSDIGYATMFAGNTDEAKALAKNARKALADYVESGSDEDYNAFMEAIGALDDLARKTKSDYKTKANTYTYDDMYGEDGLFGAIAQRTDVLQRAHDVGASRYEIPEVTETVPETTAEAPEVPALNQNEYRMPTQDAVPALGEEKVRSFSKRGAADETLPEEVRESLSTDMYRVVKNADVEARANELFDPNDLTKTRSNFDNAVEHLDPSAASLAYKLAKAYTDAGQYDAAIDVLQKASEGLTRGGQFTQAAKLAMLQNDPMAALRSYMRDLDKLNEWGSKKYKKKWTNLELSQEDIDMFNQVQKGDSDMLNAVVDYMNKKFGKQIPSNWWDKIVGATKTSMLLNMRTQGRNIGANTAMLPVRSLSDRVSAVGQNIAHLINPDIEVTQSLTGGTAKQKEIAGEIFDQFKDSILNENKMKDSVQSDI